MYIDTSYRMKAFHENRILYESVKFSVKVLYGHLRKLSGKLIQIFINSRICPLYCTPYPLNTISLLLDIV